MHGSLGGPIAQKKMNIMDTDITLVVDFIVSGKLLLVLAFITSGNTDDLSLVSSGNFEVFLLPGIGSAAFGSSIRGIFGWGGVASGN